MLIATTKPAMDQSPPTKDQSLPTTDQSLSSTEQSLETSEPNRQSRKRPYWTWEDMVNLIDYVDNRKNDGITWTKSQRLHLCEQEALRRLFPALTSQQVFRRLEHLSYDWVKQELSSNSALFKHGWSAMKSCASRESLLSYPSNTERPKPKEGKSRMAEPGNAEKPRRKKGKSRMTEPETLINWSMNSEP